jgi:hypothetical protein
MCPDSYTTFAAAIPHGAYSHMHVRVLSNINNHCYHGVSWCASGTVCVVTCVWGRSPKRRSAHRQAVETVAADESVCERQAGGESSRPWH